MGGGGDSVLDRFMLKVNKEGPICLDPCNINDKTPAIGCWGFKRGVGWHYAASASGSLSLAAFRAAFSSARRMSSD